MNLLHISTMAEYWRVVRTVMDHGKRRKPRGIETRDIGPLTVILDDTVNALPIGVGRGLKPAIGALEAIQLIAGVAANPELVLRVEPRFREYMNGTTSDVIGWFHGSYGKRIGYQMKTVARRLAVDDATRQAVVTLWDPRMDQTDGMKDYPCTVGFGFAVNDDGQLDMNVVMRSNDVWRGFAYDVFQFTQLQWTLARALQRYPGVYRHTTWSMHLYESDVENADQVIGHPHTAYREAYQPHGIGLPRDSMSQSMARARTILRGDEPNDITDGERWYLEQLHPKSTKLG